MPIAPVGHHQLRLKPKLELASQLHAFLFVLVLFGYSFTAIVYELLFTDLDSRAVTVPFRALVAGLSLVVLWSIGIERKRLAAPLLWPVLLVFWTIYITRVIIETADPSFVGEATATDYLTFSIGVSVIPMLAMLCRPTPGTTRLALRWAVFAAFAFIIGGLVLSGNIATVLAEQFRMSLTIINPILVGHTGASVIIVIVCWLTFDEDARKPHWLILGLAAAVPAFVSVLLAGSRGPMLALICASVPFVAVLLLRRGASQWVFLVIAGGLTAVSVSLMDGFLVLGDSQDVLDSLGRRTLEDLRTSESYIRVYLLRSAFDIFLQNPFTGGALVDPLTGMSPHNLLAESLMATGIIGGICVLILLAVTMHAWFRIVTRSPAAVWIAMLSVQYTVGAMFSGAIWASTSFWCFAAAAVAVRPTGRVLGRIVSSHAAVGSGRHAAPDRLVVPPSGRWGLEAERQARPGDARVIGEGGR